MWEDAPHVSFLVSTVNCWLFASLVLAAAILWLLLGHGSFVLVVAAAVERAKAIVHGAKDRIKNYKQTIKEGR